jgi:hypothetical protein
LKHIVETGRELEEYVPYSGIIGIFVSQTWWLQVKLVVFEMRIAGMT